METLAYTLKQALVSPNEVDSNGEEANIVDGLFAIARAIDRLTHALNPRGGPE